jgi:hypothetical protein
MTLTLVSGCATTDGPEIRVNTDSVLVCTDPPRADPVKMRGVAPRILLQGEDVWVAMTIREYENVSLNLQDVLSHIRQKNAIIRYYRRCIDERSNEHGG